MIKQEFLRLMKDDSGLHSVEIALGIALIAAIAGFGMIALGDGIGTFFQTTGEGFAPGTQMPDQSGSTSGLVPGGGGDGGDGGGDPPP